MCVHNNTGQELTNLYVGSYGKHVYHRKNQNDETVFVGELGIGQTSELFAVEYWNSECIGMSSYSKNYHLIDCISEDIPDKGNYKIILNDRSIDWEKLPK